MNKSKFLNLAADEILVKIVRQSPWAYLGSTILVILLIIVPFFFLFPFFSWGTKGKMIFFLLLGLGIVYGLKFFLVWYLKIFVITNQRIVDVDQQGLFKKTVSEIPLTKISEVFYKIKGIRQTIFRYGIVSIVVSPGQQYFEIRNVSKPYYHQQLILRLQSEISKGELENTKLSAQELLELVERIKAGIGEEKFHQIIDNKTKP